MGNPRVSHENLITPVGESPARGPAVESEAEHIECTGNYKGLFRRSRQDIWASYRPLCCRVRALMRLSFKLGRPSGRTDFFCR